MTENDRSSTESKESEDVLRGGEFLSPFHEGFAQYSNDVPEGTLGAAYERLAALDASTLCRAQPWPVFLSRRQAEELAAISSAVAGLLLSLPRRIFGNDPARYEEFYGIDRDSAGLLATLVDETDILDRAATRGDYFWTDKGLQLIELNVGGGLGGWSIGTWTRAYLGDPLIQEFLRKEGLQVSFVNPARELFSRILENAPDSSGEHNIAFMTPTADFLEGSGSWPEDYRFEYRQLLAEHPERSGETLICQMGDLEQRGEGLFLGSQRIHTVVEACDGNLDRVVLSALLAGTIQVYNGPVSRILGDKLNLALLSELEESDWLNESERRIVRDHVPWTRRITADFVDYGTERAYLPDLLMDQQQDLVIKPGASAHGLDVFLGIATENKAWEQVVDRALEEPGWVVQERVEGRTYRFPLDEEPRNPLQPHDVVWGLLTTGTEPIGNFVRLMSRKEHGVINAARGARVGAVLEVEDGA